MVAFANKKLLVILLNVICDYYSSILLLNFLKYPTTKVLAAMKRTDFLLVQHCS